MAKKERMLLDRLIIFTRYPEPGMTKTRLIPVLGPEGAADLHRRMGEHTMAWARFLQTHSPVSVEVRFAGGDENLLRQWLGPDFLYHDQGRGDLGERMARAIADSFQSGGERVVLVGTDCPGLTGVLVQRALELLKSNDLVLGPASDGGYYLIGVRRIVPQLFSEILWGTSEVLEKTLRIADKMQLRVFLLEPLDDVDRPEDLPVWEKFAQGNFPLISIIIPTLNEEENIAACLRGTLNASQVERIVVDGGSRDQTMEIARSCGAKVINSPTGRARQMNAGAEMASGDLLLFLHADTLLPEGFDDCVRQVLTQPGVAAGAFEFRLDATSRGLQIIERIANWRSRFLQLPYGDQAIFIRSALFREMGRYPDMPILEDFELVRRLKRKGRIHTASYPAITSARRWMAGGVWKTTLSHQLIVAAYYLGVSPTLIHRFAGRSR
ncbi:MAG: TIGR04283 family arsenosugar biosynthesis glycosyltransferase [Deltaproteobacteria bacterium]|nr:TIGR04283 family arsenosugar biosynthesis glycosyltransferase [Deltaproteobacteria bacterium]